MVLPSSPPPPRRAWDDPRLRFPDEATWARLSADERDEVIARILAALGEYREVMSEGVRHFRNKAGVGAELDAYFRRANRRVFIACELAAFYPGEAVIVPDVLAVLDCDPDIEPDTWVVADQKRGIDLVIEVRNMGKKHKDLVENVQDYARLRIPEYFSFDCRGGFLRGWHLAAPDADRYQPILPQKGYLRSSVLGLELAVVDRRLRFFANQALVPDARELLERLQAIADERQGALQEAELRASDAVERLSRAQVALARSVIEACRLRGIALSPEQHAQVASSLDADQLARWAERAFAATSAAELLADT